MPTDTFLTHDWGTDEENRKNHDRVAMVNDELKKNGYSTWFDSDKMTGNIVDQMCRGIDNTQVVLVFITARYCSKVAGENEGDNCKMEFNYAVRRRGIPNMIPIVMEKRMKNTANWGGALGMAMGGILYIDFSGDRASVLSKMPDLMAEIDKRTGGKRTGGQSVQPRSTGSSTGGGNNVLDAIKSGSAVVKIKKASGAGAGYYLIAHSDKRNHQSVWALSHTDRPVDKEDQKWNVLTQTQDGKQHYKLQKAVQRNKGLMLTGHSDKKPNGNIRTLVHSQNHNIPDECWQFVPNGNDTFKIVKSCNRNKGMWLVNSEQRNSGSYWVDISSNDDDCSWIVTLC